MRQGKDRDTLSSLAKGTGLFDGGVEIECHQDYNLSLSVSYQDCTHRGIISVEFSAQNLVCYIYIHHVHRPCNCQWQL